MRRELGDRPRRAAVWVGNAAVDRITMEQAIDAIDSLVLSRRGGAVFTPNVDHVVQLEDHRELQHAYASAELKLPDGMPILWAGRLLGQPFPEKVSGADLLWPLMERAARRKYRVYLLGGAPGAAEKAARRFREELGVDICGVDDAFLDDPRQGETRARVIARIREAQPQLLIVAFGAPKQELFIHSARAELGPVVALGLGASLDFVAGITRRAPKWMSNNGLEWAYRLFSEPKRLWRRYLLRDPAFARIVLRQLWARRRPALPAPATR